MYRCDELDKGAERVIKTPRNVPFGAALGRTRYLSSPRERVLGLLVFDRERLEPDGDRRDGGGVSAGWDREITD